MLSAALPTSSAARVAIARTVSDRDRAVAARDSEVSGQPIRERLHELGHASVSGFLEHHLVYRRSLIFCRRPNGPPYAPNHRDAANVVPSRAILDWPESDIVYPHNQRAPLRRYAAPEGLAKLIR